MSWEQRMTAAEDEDQAKKMYPEIEDELVTALYEGTDWAYVLGTLQNLTIPDENKPKILSNKKLMDTLQSKGYSEKVYVYLNLSTTFENMQSLVRHLEDITSLAEGEDSAAAVEIMFRMSMHDLLIPDLYRHCTGTLIKLLNKDPTAAKTLCNLSRDTSLLTALYDTPGLVDTARELLGKQVSVDTKHAVLGLIRNLATDEVNHVRMGWATDVALVCMSDPPMSVCAILLLDTMLRTPEALTETMERGDVIPHILACATSSEYAAVCLSIFTDYADTSKEAVQRLAVFALAFIDMMLKLTTSAIDILTMLAVNDDFPFAQTYHAIMECLGKKPTDTYKMQARYLISQCISKTTPNKEDIPLLLDLCTMHNTTPYDAIQVCAIASVLATECDASYEVATATGLLDSLATIETPEPYVLRLLEILAADPKAAAAMERFMWFATKYAEKDETETGGTHLIMELAMAGVTLGPMTVDVLVEISCNGIDHEGKAYALCALAYTNPTESARMLKMDEFMESLVTQTDERPFCIQLIGKLSLHPNNKQVFQNNEKIVGLLLENKRFDILSSICTNKQKMWKFPGLRDTVYGNVDQALELLHVLTKDEKIATEISKQPFVFQKLLRNHLSWTGIDFIMNLIKNPDNMERICSASGTVMTLVDMCFNNMHVVLLLSRMTRNQHAAEEAVIAVDVFKTCALNDTQREIRIAAAETLLNIVSWPRARAKLITQRLFDELLNESDTYRLAVLGQAIQNLEGEAVSVSTEECAIMEEALRSAIDGQLPLQIPIQAIAAIRRNDTRFESDECMRLIRMALQIAKDNKDQISKLYAASLLV